MRLKCRRHPSTTLTMVAASVSDTLKIPKWSCHQCGSTYSSEIVECMYHGYWASYDVTHEQLAKQTLREVN